MSEPHPFTEREWDAMRNVPGGSSVTFTKIDLDRLEATLAHGFAPDEPSNDELNRWAALHVMQWHSLPAGGGRGRVWRDAYDTPVAGSADWKPAERIDQALQVAMETDIVVSIKSDRLVQGGPKQAVAYVIPKRVYRGPFEPEVIARAILLELHRRIEGAA